MHDCEGWVTCYGVECADGLTIRHGAFKNNTGRRVPVFWNHQHGDVSQVLGHAELEDRDGGVYGYITFNRTQRGVDAKEIVHHGDVEAFSIWANGIQKRGNDVFHGAIKEVSLVPAGANPGAFIESIISHGESLGDDEDEAILYSGKGIVIPTPAEPISHGTEPKADDIQHADGSAPKSQEPPKKDDGEGGEKTVKEILNTLTDEQKAAVGILLSEVEKNGEGEGGSDMRHHAFEGDGGPAGSYISHDDMKQILEDAKEIGSLRKSVMQHMENGVLAHSIDTTGMTGPSDSTKSQTYGFRDPDMLFPDYRTVGGNTPQWISRNMDWVTKVLSKVHHTPFSRIKSVFADITEDEARAKGYIKGNMKKEEVFTLLKRTTSPTTIYKKQKMDRDDELDIVDFDVLAWIRAEMRIMLNEEIARAILIGDGRQSDSEDKIKEDCVRPVVTDVPLFNVVVKVKVAPDADEATIAKETIKAVIRARKKYKGSGRPDFWTTEDVVTEMLLLENGIQEPLYKTESELSTKLRVAEIIPVEVMEGQEVEVIESSDGGSSITKKKYPLIGTIVNLGDYNVGADKGGEINMFDDFDIDYNQKKYLIETRISGALIRPFSALTLVLDKTGTVKSSTMKVNVENAKEFPGAGA